MCKDISCWCRACEIRTLRQVGKPVKPLLTRIPVSGAFDRVGVDVIKFPRSSTGKKETMSWFLWIT